MDSSSDDEKAESRGKVPSKISVAKILFEPPLDDDETARKRRDVAAARRLTEKLRRPYKSLQDLLDAPKTSPNRAGNFKVSRPAEPRTRLALAGDDDSVGTKFKTPADGPGAPKRNSTTAKPMPKQFLRPLNLSLALRSRRESLEKNVLARGKQKKDKPEAEKPTAEEAREAVTIEREKEPDDIADIAVCEATSDKTYLLGDDSVPDVLETEADEKEEEEEQEEGDEEDDDEDEVEVRLASGEEPSKAIDDTLRHVLRGSLDRPVPAARKVVRIFTSSTFTDTTLERNCLMERVYPKLKEYCMERYGLDFQVVDMRWGVRDEATDDHMTSDLCLQEIDNCQRLSLGPNFVVFLGQKYGYRPIPSVLGASTMDALKGVIGELRLENGGLIDQWYRKDENAVPPVYVLQPISSILVNFNNKRVHRLMEKDQAAWWDVAEKLQGLLRRGAAELRSRGLMSEEEEHDFVMSVTEREVRRGIIGAEDPGRHCLAYIRRIGNIDTSEAGLKLARNYLDMIGSEVDREADRLLSVLRDELLPAKLPASNVVRYNVEWCPGDGIGPMSHSEYLDQFCSVFYRDVCELVDRAAEERTSYGEFDRIFAQVQHHQTLCLALSKNFSGRDEILEKMRSYLRGSSTEPLILYGEGGCGKTSILAKAFSMLEFWIEEGEEEDKKDKEETATSDRSLRPLYLIRFLGSSLDSSSAPALLTSLVQQIGFHLDDSVDHDLPRELTALSLRFKTELGRAGPQRPVFLFLDSLDQLASTAGSHDLAWFPFSLPGHCKVVASVPSERLALVSKLRKFLGEAGTENFLEVPPLGRDQGLQVVRSMLANANRTLNPKQWRTVERTVEKCSEPLFLKILSGVVSKWRSYESASASSAGMASTTRDAITKLFERVEGVHGKVLVSHAFGYIAVSKSGLTEAELEDLLSLDEAVLNDVYQYHLPPVRRIPPLLWTRIRSDLSDYISEREADGVNVINWSHARFADVTRERYFKNLNVLSETHSLMADYFAGVWGGVPKPFQYSDLQCQRFELDTAYGSCDRKVSEQPLYFVDKRTRASAPTGRRLSFNSASSDGSAALVRYNLRKLNEMPFHLARSRRCSELDQLVLFNFRWLLAKLSAAASVQSLVEDYDEALAASRFDREEIRLVRDCLKLSASVVEGRPDMLAPQLTGRLLPLCSQHPLVRRLLEQSDADGVALNALTPCYNCFQTPGGPLEISLEGHRFASFGLCVTSDFRFLVSASNRFIVWDLTKMETVRQSGIGTLGIVMQMVLTDDDSKAIAYTNSGQILIYAVLTGESTLIDNAYLLERGDEELFGLSTNGSVFAVWSHRSWFTFGLDGTLLSSNPCPRLDDGGNVVHLYLDAGASAAGGDRHLLVWKFGYPSGVASRIEMFLSGMMDSRRRRRKGKEEREEEGEWGRGSPGLSFHSGIAVTRDRRTAFACTDGNVVRRFALAERGSSWSEVEVFPNETNVYSLFLSGDESVLGATHTTKFTVWFLEGRGGAERRSLELNLPKNVRNFPRKVCISESTVFCKDDEYFMAPIRQVLYVWETRTGTLVNSLDAHFRRILKVIPIFAAPASASASASHSSSEGFAPEHHHRHHQHHQQQQQQLHRDHDSCRYKFVTASLDKSIKVWNLASIRENVYSIDNHEKQIEQITCVDSGRGWLAVTTTRNCVGVWNLDTGRLTTSLVGTRASSSVVSHSGVTSRGEFVFSVEGSRLTVWDVAAGFRAVRPDAPGDGERAADGGGGGSPEEPCVVRQACVGPDDKHVFLAKTRSSDSTLAVLEKRRIPGQEVVYRISYRFKTFVPFALTNDGKFVIVPAACGGGSQARRASGPSAVLRVYSAETGERAASSVPKYRRYKEFQKIVAMPNKTSRVALLDVEKGNIWDWRRKALVRSVSRWSGRCSPDGQLGLTDPSMGGLQVVSLKTGATVRTLVARQAEGLHPDNRADFTPSAEHVYFYHAGRKSVRLFRLSDGCKIADYRVHAEITSDLSVAHDSRSLVLGGLDGSLVVLAIGDPLSGRHVDFVAEKRRSYYRSDAAS